MYNILVLHAPFLSQGLPHHIRNKWTQTYLWLVLYKTRCT